MKKLNIIYEDKELLVVEKESHQLTIATEKRENNTLYSEASTYVKKQYPKNKVFIVHRLDKDTSGLLVIAKNNKSHAILSEYFKKHDNIKREYIALICGNFPHDSATIDAPIGRDPKDRKKMTVTATNSKEAITHLKVLKKYKDYTLVSLILETGRTHQIRVHMNYIGYPVYNDPVYNTKKCTEFGQFLHSHKMDFIHPITNKEMHFESPLPEEFQSFIDSLDKDL